MTVLILNSDVFSEHLGMIQFYCDSENVVDFSYTFETDTREVEFSFIASTNEVTIKYKLDTDSSGDAIKFTLDNEDLEKRILYKVPVGEYVEIREKYKEIFPSDYTPVIGGNLYRNFSQDKYITKNTYDNFICSRDIEGHYFDDLGRIQKSYTGQKKVIKSLHLIVPSLVKRDGSENYYYSSTELNEDERISWFAVSGKYVYDLYDLDNNLIRSDLTEVTPYVTIVNSEGNRAEPVPGILNVPEGNAFNNTYYGYLYYETLNGDFDYIKSDNYIILEKFKVARQEPLGGELAYEEGGIPLYIVGPYAGNYTQFNVLIDPTFSPEDIYIRTGKNSYSKAEVKSYEGIQANIDALLGMRGNWTHDDIPDDLEVEPGGIFYITDDNDIQHYYQYCSGWVKMPWYVNSSTIYDPSQLSSNHVFYPGAGLTNKVGQRTYRRQCLPEDISVIDGPVTWKSTGSDPGDAILNSGLVVYDGQEDLFPMGRSGSGDLYTYYSSATEIIRKVDVFNSSQILDTIIGDYLNNVDEKYPWESFTNPIESVTIGCSDIFRKYFSFSANITEEGLENGTITITITALEDNNEANPWRPSYANVHPILNVSTIMVRESGKQGSIPVATVSFYVVQKSSKIGIIPVEYLNESSNTGKDLEYDYDKGAFILPVEGTIGVKTKFIGLRSEVDPYDEIVRSWRITETWNNGTREYFFRSYSGEFEEKIVMYTSAINEDLPIFKVSDFINRSSLWRRAIYESTVSILPRVSSASVVDIDNGLTKYEVDAPTPFFINTSRLFLFKEIENKIAKKFHIIFSRTALPLPENLEIQVNGRSLTSGTEYVESVDATTGLKYSLFVGYDSILSQLYGEELPTESSGWYLDFEGNRILEEGGRELKSLLKISHTSEGIEKFIYVYYSGFKKEQGDLRGTAEMGILVDRNTSFNQGLNLLPTNSPVTLSFRLGDSEDQLISYYVGTEKVGNLKLFDETNEYYEPSSEEGAITTIRVPEISKYHVTSVYEDPVMKKWELLLPNDRIFGYEVKEGNDIIKEPDTTNGESALAFNLTKSHFVVTADEEIGGIDEIRVFRIGNSSNMFQDWRFYVYNRYPSTFRFIKSSGSDKIRILRHPGDSNDIEEMVLDRIGLYRVYVSITDTNTVTNLNIGKSGDNIEIYFADVNANNIVTRQQQITEEKRSIPLGNEQTSKIVYFWYEGGTEKINADSFLTFSYTDGNGKENQKSIVLSQNTGGAFPNQKYLEGFLDVVHYTSDQRTTKIPADATPLPICREDNNPRNLAIPVVTTTSPSYSQSPGSIEIIQGSKYPYKFRYSSLPATTNENVEFSEIFEDEDPIVSIVFPEGFQPGQEPIDDENNSLYVLNSFEKVTRHIKVKDEYKNKRDGKRFVFQLSFDRPSSNESVSFCLCYYQPVIVLNTTDPSKNNVYISLLSESSESYERSFYPTANGKSIESSGILRYLDSEGNIDTNYPVFDSGVDTKAFEIRKPEYVHTGKSTTFVNNYPHFSYALFPPVHPNQNSDKIKPVNIKTVWLTYKNNGTTVTATISNSALDPYVEIQTQKFYSSEVISLDQIKSFLSTCDFLEINVDYNIKFTYWLYTSGETYYNYDFYKWNKGIRTALSDDITGGKRYYGALTWYSDFSTPNGVLTWKEEQLFKVFTIPTGNSETPFGPRNTNRFFIQSRSNTAGALISNMDNMNGKNYIGLAALLMNLYIWDYDYFSFSDEMNEYWSTYIYPNDTWKLSNHTAAKWFPTYQKVEGGIKSTIERIPSIPEERSYLDMMIPARVFATGPSGNSILRFYISCNDSTLRLLNGSTSLEYYNSHYWTIDTGSIKVTNIVKKIKYGEGATKNAVSEWKWIDTATTSRNGDYLGYFEIDFGKKVTTNVYLEFYFTDIKETIFGEIKKLHPNSNNYNSLEIDVPSGVGSGVQEGALRMRCSINDSNYGLLIGNSELNTKYTELVDHRKNPHSPGYSIDCITTGTFIKIDVRRKNESSSLLDNPVEIEHCGSQCLAYFPLGQDVGVTKNIKGWDVPYLTYSFEDNGASGLDVIAVIPGFHRSDGVNFAFNSLQPSIMERIILSFWGNSVYHYSNNYSGEGVIGTMTSIPDNVLYVDSATNHSGYSGQIGPNDDEITDIVDNGNNYFYSDRDILLNHSNNIYYQSVSKGDLFYLCDRNNNSLFNIKIY